MLWQLNLLIIKELFVGKWDSDFQIFIWEWQYSFSQDISGTNADTEGLLPTTVTLENKMLLPIFIAGRAQTPSIWIQFIRNHKIVSSDNHH